MKKRLKIVKKSAKKSRRLLAITIILAATAILATGAVTVVSRQKAKEESSKQEARPALNGAANRNYVTVKVAGQEVQVDSQTGRMKELTPEEAQKLAAGLKQMINRSTDGLVQEPHADGSVSVDLQDRFQNVTVARINEDGSLATSCVDNAEAAGTFFGIDPQLIDDKLAGRSAGKPLPLKRSDAQDK